MYNDCLLQQINRYKNNVLNCLMHKYNMDENNAIKIMQQSYLSESLTKFPEETIYIDVETTADDIYFDYKMRRYG